MLLLLLLLAVAWAPALGSGAHFLLDTAPEPVPVHDLVMASSTEHKNDSEAGGDGQPADPWADWIQHNAVARNSASRADRGLDTTLPIHIVKQFFEDIEEQHKSLPGRGRLADDLKRKGGWESKAAFTTAKRSFLDHCVAVQLAAANDYGASTVPSNKNKKRPGDGAQPPAKRSRPNGGGNPFSDFSSLNDSNYVRFILCACTLLIPYLFFIRGGSRLKHSFLFLKVHFLFPFREIANETTDLTEGPTNLPLLESAPGSVFYCVSLRILRSLETLFLSGFYCLVCKSNPNPMTFLGLKRRSNLIPLLVYHTILLSSR